MTGKEKIIHKVSVNTGQPMVLPRHGAFAMRRSRLLKRRFRQVFYTAGFILSMGAISHASYGFLMETPLFMIKAPRVEGVSEPLRKEITGLVASLTANNHNLLSIDAPELEKQIAMHPRIRDIEVTKVYPDELRIVAAERQEVAVVVTENGFHMLDSDGHVMEKLEPADLTKVDYPFISGLRTEEVNEGEPVDGVSLRNAISLLEVLKARNEKLYHLISEIEIQSDRASPLETLTAHMKGGLDIKFCDSNPVEKLPALETMLHKLRSEGVKPFSDLVYIEIGFDGMCYCLDKATALVVERDQYDQVQQAMNEAAEEYEENHPDNGKPELRYDSSRSRRDSGTAKSSAQSSNEKPSTGKSDSSRKAAQNHRAAYEAYYRQQQTRQPARQQYPSQQYYQQRQYQNQRQAAPMYNLPANQQRY